MDCCVLNSFNFHVNRHDHRRRRHCNRRMFACLSLFSQLCCWHNFNDFFFSLCVESSQRFVHTCIKWLYAIFSRPQAPQPVVYSGKLIIIIGFEANAKRIYARCHAPLYITSNLCTFRMQIRIIVSYLLRWLVDWFSFRSHEHKNALRHTVPVFHFVDGIYLRNHEGLLQTSKEKSVAPIYRCNGMAAVPVGCLRVSLEMCH